MQKFQATLEIIDGNPFVFVPEEILTEIFSQAQKTKGQIPICGTINGKNYKQTLLRYKGEWRLYINAVMLKNSPKRIGEMVEVTAEFDPIDRTITPNPKFLEASHQDVSAKKVFDSLSPSKQKEIVRYISFLKLEETINRNIERAIGFLNGKNSFVGREKP